MSNPTEEQVEAGAKALFEEIKELSEGHNWEDPEVEQWHDGWKRAARLALVAAAEVAAPVDNGKCGGCRDLGPHRDVPGCEYYREDAADVRSRLSLLLDHCTGARLSKSIYTVEVMIRAIEDHYARVASDQAEDEGAGEEIAAAWLADVQREAAEKALTDAAEQFATRDGIETLMLATDDVSAVQATEKWLLERAATYRRNEGEQ